ncbi:MULTISPECIES: acyclic terpene utilization AtuA family protein [Ramlibacter]|uniref:Acyclic terpene utilization AtuA family protein n=1 Tax=Ramlibacter pinisoli TaxID=2682844 RepID=A0A6N8IPM5_9BURK|nr:MULTISPECIES: acyclic terpene utilization AtuA family protein [Ramlibacter]MBA2963822.1 DUF1446 domain-containing protein [Ramlibacter sp. CGMCC 1.13660]MVQ28788.1 acyclic terpene utilization AtuA family protein [Ramlibacter pinisoli]
MAPPPLFIGCGAGFSGDRTDAAGPVVDTLVTRLRQRPGARAYLMFETLAERTLALAQLRRSKDPSAGYELLLEDLLEPVLARCLEHGIGIVGNFGAANPPGAAQAIHALARRLGLPVPRIAVITGDDLSSPEHAALLREHAGPELDNLQVLSANAYLGARPIADAFQAGAQIVVAGRVADPALALGPAMAHFGWRDDDWDRLAGGTMAGHLLECGAQVTGGYFADPGLKDVPDLHAVGFPVVELFEDGSCIVGKADGTGGMVNLATVKEQLLYEVHDPAAYLTPDVVADITQAQVEAVGENTVALRGVRGHARPATLKVNVFHDGGWLAEGEISYAGPRAADRARLAADVLRKRLPTLAVRYDVIGVSSVFGDDAGRTLAALPSPGSGTGPRDARLRAAAAHPDKREAQRLVREVTALYTCGPAAGGGVRTALTPRLNNLSCYVPRERVTPAFHLAGEGDQ